jgi:hypothetical protein
VESGQGLITAICTNGNDAIPGLAFSIDALAFYKDKANLSFGLGNTGALIMTVPPGRKASWKFVIGFFRDGIVTAGLNASYLYTRYFHSIEEVVSSHCAILMNIGETALQSDSIIDGTSLSYERKFMMAHAIRCYYGSTQL